MAALAVSCIGIRAADIPVSGNVAFNSLSYTGTDTVVITGGASGTLSLSSTLPLALPYQFVVTDSIAATGVTAFNDTRYGATFKPSGTGWALVSYSAGRLFTITESGTGDIKLNLDKMIFDGPGTGGTTNGAVIYGTGTDGAVDYYINIVGDVIFRNNNLVAGGRGGAADVYRNSLKFSGNVIFDSNSTTGNTSSLGGAINMRGSATGQQLLFEKNAVFLNNKVGGTGGAMNLANSTTMTVTGTAIFIGNMSGVGQTSNQYGGAIMYGNNSNALVGKIEFKNTAWFESNAASNGGGGIHMYGPASLIFGGDAIFISNTSGYNLAAGNGGAIGMTNGGASASGTVSFMGSSTFIGNVAGGHGGAIYIQNTPVLKFTKNTTFSGNIAGNATGSYDGGALLLATGSLVLAPEAGATVLFEGNRASRYGGAIYGSDNVFLSGDGGDIQFLHNVTNGANANGGGAIFVNTGKTLYADETSKLVFDGNFAGDTSRSADGGAIRANNARVVISGSALFEGNQATRNGGAIYFDGGSIMSEPMLDLSGNVTFANNHANGSGGAIALAGNAANSLSISTTTPGSTGIQFTGNTAKTNGGAIAIVSAGSSLVLDAQVADITFENNRQGVSTNTATIDTEAIRSTGAGGYLTATGGSLNDIYFSGSDQKLSISAAEERTVSLLSGIANADIAGLVTTVIKSGSGTVRLGAVSDINANTTVQEGDFMLADDATYGRANTGTFTVQANAALGGSGTLRAETLTLETGAIVRAGGTLAFDVANGVSLNNATLSGTGMIAGLASATATHISIGNGSQTFGQALAFDGALTLANATVDFDIFGGTDSDTLSAGSLILTGTTALNFNEFVSGTYTLLDTTGGITNSGTWITQVNGMTVNNSRWVSDYTLLGGNTLQAVFVKYGSKELGWNLASGDWDLVSANWTDGDGFLAGDAVKFENISGTVTLAAERLTASQMTVTGTGTLVIGGTGGITTDTTAWDATNDPLPATALGQLNKSGDGTLVLANTGSNNFTEGIIIGGGALAFGRADQLGEAEITFNGSGTLSARGGDVEISSTITIDTGVRVALDVQGGTLAFNGLLTGNSGTLAKTGTGTFILGSDHTALVAPMFVEGGTLDLQAALGGDITVSSGAKLIGAGSVIAGDLTANEGSFLQVGEHGAGVTGTLNIGGALTLNGATLFYDLVATGVPPELTGHDSITASTLAMSGTNTFDFASSIVQGEYLLIEAASVSGFDADALVTKVNGEHYQVDAGRIHVTYASDTEGLKMNASLTASGTLVWTGSTDNVWKSASGADDWDGIDTKFANGDAVIFDSVTDIDQPSRRNITVDAAGVVVAEMLVTGDGDYQFTGGAIRGTDNASETLLANPTGKLTKNGEGTLTLSNASNAFAGGIELVSGTLRGNTASLNGNLVTTRADSSLVFDQSVAGAYTGTVSGAGNVYKTGAETLAVTGRIEADVFEHISGTVSGVSAISAGQYNLRGGTLLINNTLTLGRGMLLDTAGVLSGRGRVTLGSTGAFVHSGTIRIGKAADTNSAMGTLIIDGDYIGAGGVVSLMTVLNAGGAETQTDLLHITGAMSGNALLSITNDGGIGDNTGFGSSDGIKIVAVDGAITGTFSLLDPVTVGVFDYGLVQGDGGFYLQAIAPIPEIPAACALPGIAAIAGQVGFDSIRERLAALRATRGHDTGGWWLRDVYDQSKLKTGPFDGTRFHTNLVQLGVDALFKGENATWTIGAYYTNTDIGGKASGIRIKNDGKGGGVYALMQSGRFYASLLFQFDDSDYRVLIPNDEFSTDGWNYGASVEGGYTLTTSRFGTLEADAALSGQKVATGTGSNNRHKYTFDDGESFKARAGVRWHHFFALSGEEWLHPWLRAGVSHEFSNRYNMYVDDAGTPANAHTYVFENNLRGTQFDISAGFGWGITSQFSFNFSVAFTTGKAREACTASGGIRYAW